MMRLRAQGVSFTHISARLERSTPAVRNKYYMTIQRRGSQKAKRYMEILDAGKYWEYIKTHEMDGAEQIALGRTILRELGYEVRGEENMVKIGTRLYPIKTQYGTFAHLHQKDFKIPCALVWLHRDGTVVVLLVVHTK